MPRYFFDTSALIKLYHQEDGTEVVDELMDQDESLIVISDLAVVEMVSALAKKVRTQEITVDVFNAAVDAFEKDVANFESYPLSHQILQDASQLLKDKGLVDGLRTLDALQLATALFAHQWQPLDLFVASDKRLVAVVKKDSLPALLV
jgi:uncharacterized protein